MELRRFIENFETLTVKDIANNYDGIRKNLRDMQDKARNINTKYTLSNGTIEVDKIPEFVKDVNDLTNLFS